MSSSETPHGQLLARITERASTDFEFRQKVLKDPVRAIRETFGVHLPEGFRIRVIEKGPDVDALIVLPDFRGQREGLTEDELDLVAGGDGSDPPLTW